MLTAEAATEEQARPRRAKWAVGISLVAAGIFALAAWAIASPDALSYYATPSDIAARSDAHDVRLRVGGRVADGTLVRDGSRVAFLVTDGVESLGVVYHGEVPDTLQDDTDVVAEGRIGPDGVLVADRVLAKCSSKFVPAEERAAGRTDG